MRQRDDGNPPRPGRPRQKLMPQLPGRHLQRQPRGMGEGLHVRALHGHRQLQGGGCLPDQLFIQVAAASAQLVIKMRHGQLPPLRRRQGIQDVQQHHGIQPAGYRHQPAPPAPEQPPRLHARRHLLDKTDHADILSHPPAQASRPACGSMGWHIRLVQGRGKEIGVFLTPAGKIS